MQSGLYLELRSINAFKEVDRKTNGARGCTALKIGNDQDLLKKKKKNQLTNFMKFYLQIKK